MHLQYSVTKISLCSLAVRSAKKGLVIPEFYASEVSVKYPESIKIDRFMCFL